MSLMKCTWQTPWRYTVFPRSVTLSRTAFSLYFSEGETDPSPSALLAVPRQPDFHFRFKRAKQCHARNRPPLRSGQRVPCLEREVFSLTEISTSRNTVTALLCLRHISMQGEDGSSSEQLDLLVFIRSYNYN